MLGKDSLAFVGEYVLVAADSLAPVGAVFDTGRFVLVVRVVWAAVVGIVDSWLDLIDYLIDSIITFRWNFLAVPSGIYYALP